MRTNIGVCIMCLCLCVSVCARVCVRVYGMERRKEGGGGDLAESFRWCVSTPLSG